MEQQWCCFNPLNSVMKWSFCKLELFFSKYLVSQFSFSVSLFDPISKLMQYLCLLSVSQDPLLALFVSHLLLDIIRHLLLYRILDILCNVAH